MSITPDRAVAALALCILLEPGVAQAGACPCQGDEAETVSEAPTPGVDGEDGEGVVASDGSGVFMVQASGHLDLPRESQPSETRGAG